MLMLAIAFIAALCSAGVALWRTPQMPRYWPLLAVAVVPQIGSLFGIIIPWMFLGAIAAILIWCFCNWALRGAPIVALGVGLNLVVMAFHGGAMPIHADVLASIGQVAAPGTLLVGSKDVAVQSSMLWLLSDWIVIWFGANTIVLSPGDLILFTGVIWWLLFSRRLEKEDAHVDIGRHSDVARTTYSPATRAE
jgi:hypothetical protein